MERKVFDRFNFFVLFAALGLLTIGLLAIYSATFGNDQTTANFDKQLIAGCAGLLLAIIITFLPPKFLSSSAFLFYGGIVLLLVIVLVIGKRTKGQTSWFHIA